MNKPGDWTPHGAPQPQGENAVASSSRPDGADSAVGAVGAVSAADATLSAPSPAQLRTALGRFATGVTVVSCLGPGHMPVGLTVNSFSALSLEPALVLWSLRSASPSLPAFEAAGAFAVNVLAENQVDVSRRFASPVSDKFSLGLWQAGLHGLPVLAGAAAVFECRTVSSQVAGDHVLYIGEVLRVHESAVAPLLFQAGHYRMLGEVL